MNKPDRFISAHEAAGGPRWQWLRVGDRVRPKRGRKRGTVIAIIGSTPTRTGAPRYVAVRWDRTPQWSEANATDCLVVLDEPAQGEAA